MRWEGRGNGKWTEDIEAGTDGDRGNDWSEPRDEDKNAIHLSRLSILSLPFGAEGGPEAEPNGERMG
jgi:hypothetical protein